MASFPNDRTANYIHSKPLKVFLICAENIHTLCEPFTIECEIHLASFYLNTGVHIRNIVNIVNLMEKKKITDQEIKTLQSKVYF